MRAESPLVPAISRYFALPETLAAKAAPALVVDDDRHLAAVAASLSAQIDAESARLEAARRAPGGGGTAALERDQEIHRLTARLRTLRRFGVDLCLGRMVSADGAVTYIGRLGLTDARGERLLSDWRSPAAEPFFGATHGNPMGLASRRRFRWSGGRVVDYWDEAFTEEALADAALAASLEDTSAFIASLSSSRSARMRDVLGTIAADQDAVIRASAEGALVVDGGPGTGKTVVALHRAAYLRYRDPQLGEGRGGVLVVGPHQPYLEYVSDVLPSLGEEGVRTCTLLDLLPEGATARPETDDVVAALKSTVDMVRAIERGAAFYEDPPSERVEVETPWGDTWLGPRDWAAAFAAAPGAPHNEAREEVWEELLAIAVERFDGDEDLTEEQRRTAVARDRGLARAFNAAWPVVDAADLVADLWTVPAFLRHCAPHLDRDQLRALRRADGQAWTTADLPLLDAARLRLGDPETSRRRRREDAAAAARRAEMADVVADLIEHDDSELAVMSMLRGEDLQVALVDDGSGAAAAGATTDPLAGPFAHVVVDEAQELTDAQWQMLRSRCPSGSLTIVGDRAQARAGFTERWEERLRRVGVGRVRRTSLGVNYRTPAEVMAVAEPEIIAAIADANVPTSIRSGPAVVTGSASALAPTLRGWLGEHDGVACVIAAGTNATVDLPADLTARVRWLTPTLAKGLEFDLVVLLDPDGLGDGVTGAVDRYVAMTRATHQLVVLRPEV